MVGLNSDASVRRNKGPERPITPEAERAELLAGLDCVDAVVLFDEDTPDAIIRAVQPDVLVKGADWAADRVAEWFPVLAARKSVATVQGSEWLPGHEFDRRYTAYEILSKCAARDVECVERWAAANRATFTHLYVAKTMGRSGLPGHDCCIGVLTSALSDPRYQRVYDGPGAAVFVRR